MKFARATDKRSNSGRVAPKRSVGGFTLAEVLAAMLFMAIVIPVAIEALHIASLAGEVGTRKTEAARVADRILNENIVTTNWTQSSQSGTTVENGHEFRWMLKSQLWPSDSAMQMLSAEVAFSAGGHEYSVRMNTLASSPTLGGTTMAGAR